MQTCNTKYTCGNSYLAAAGANYYYYILVSRSRDEAEHDPGRH